MRTTTKSPMMTATVKRDGPVTATDQTSETVSNKNKPPRILFLLIGPPKMGTTTIQDSFDANPEPLIRDGYKYLGMRNPAGKRDKFGVRSGLKKFRRRKKKNFIHKLVQELNREDVGNFIVSAEVRTLFIVQAVKAPTLLLILMSICIRTLRICY